MEVRAVQPSALVAVSGPVLGCAGRGETPQNVSEPRKPSKCHLNRDVTMIHFGGRKKSKASLSALAEKRKLPPTRPTRRRACAGDATNKVRLPPPSNFLTRKNAPLFYVVFESFSG